MVIRHDGGAESLCATDPAGCGTVHVCVPLASKPVLRDVAGALRQLADTIEAQSTLKGVSEFGALVRVKFEVRHVNNRIAAVCAEHGIGFDRSGAEAGGPGSTSFGEARNGAPPSPEPLAEPAEADRPRNAVRVPG